MGYEKQINDAEQELLKLKQQRMDIDRQMRGWIQVIAGLRMLAGEDTTNALISESESASFPSKIVAALCQIGRPVRPTQIRDHMVMNRMVDASAKNLMINIHTTLRRLMATDQIEEKLLEDGDKLYRYVSPLERALVAPYGASNSLANMLSQPEVRSSSRMETARRGGLTPPPKPPGLK
jgi:hypothetical protein